MKLYIRLLVACILFGILVITWYIIYSPQSHTDIAITVATVLGLALTTIGTQIGIIAINKSHEATMIQYRLTEIEIHRKIAYEIYENMLVPLQSVMNDISTLGDSLFDNGKQKKDDNGKIVIPEKLPPQLAEHQNIFKAKTNMLVLYAHKEVYNELFNTANNLSKEIDVIITHYYDRIWSKNASESLVKSKKLASKLYADILDLYESDSQINLMPYKKAQANASEKA